MNVEFAELRPDERLLSGSWIQPGSAADHDEVDRRIFWLVSRRLIPLALADGGWHQLFKDPRDGRLWELSFPYGSLHGGGPRRRECVAALVAAERYGGGLG